MNNRERAERSEKNTASSSDVGLEYIKAGGGALTSSALGLGATIASGELALGSAGVATTVGLISVTMGAGLGIALITVGGIAWFSTDQGKLLEFKDQLISISSPYGQLGATISAYLGNSYSTVMEWAATAANVGQIIDFASSYRTLMTEGGFWNSGVYLDSLNNLADPVNYFYEKYEAYDPFTLDYTSQDSTGYLGVDTWFGDRPGDGELSMPSDSGYGSDWDDSTPENDEDDSYDYPGDEGDYED